MTTLPGSPAPNAQPPRIVVLGSCTADLVFAMPRFPAPGETLFADDVQLHAGGKGLNQAIAAQRLGARASLIGRVGADTFGRLLLDTLSADGVDTRHVAIDPGAGSGIAVPVVLPRGENSILSAPRANLAITLAQLEDARESIATADALLLQFEAPMDVNLAAARMAVDHGVPVFLNAAPIVPHPSELLELATVLVVNEVEVEMLTPELSSSATLHDRARTLAALGRATVIVTIGSEGALVVTADAVTHVPAFPANAIDTVGAGDAFCAALAVARARGSTIPDATRFANAAGAISVGRRGAAASLPYREEVEHMLGKPDITFHTRQGGSQETPV